MRKIFWSFIVSMCLLMITTLIPIHVLAASSVCNVTSVITPSGATIESGMGIKVIKATVPNSTTSITVNVTVSPYASWKLYSDYNCINEISNKQMNLNVGSYNYAYIKVTAQDNTTTKTYNLMVTREAISRACDVTAITLPCGAIIGENTITATVPIATSSVALNVNTSKYSSWKLYSDVNCTNEISNKQMSLKVGNNTAYIKVTAQNNTTTKKYTLMITRAEVPISTASDVTQQVSVLGQPFLSNKGIYPRNVWDMQVFDDKIYLGFGDTMTDAGPIPIIYFDPPTGEFVTEDIRRYNSTTKNYETVKAVDEEQISIYKVLNGKLYIPGYDSRESWNFGNYYVMDNNGWQKFRNIPDGIHVFDMAYYKGKLFAGISDDYYVDQYNNGANVFMSEDNGNAWNRIGSIQKSLGWDAKVYTLFEFKNKLYAVDALVASNIPKLDGSGYESDTAKILCIEQDSNGTIRTSNVTVYGKKMIPGVEQADCMRMVRTNEVNNKLLFIAGQKYKGSKWLPGGLYVAADINSAQKISLPEQDALAMDILVRGNTAYVLAYVKVSNNEYTNIIYKSDDLNNWTELFRFEKDTYARSFEELNGDFYFGLGCYMDYLPASTGTILMVKKSAYQISNAELSSLTISCEMSPAFDSKTTNYSASVGNSIYSVTITPTTADSNATVKVNDISVDSTHPSQTINLNVGINTITVLVTARDNTTIKTYTLTVTREAPPLSSACDITAVNAPSGATIGADTITANVPNDTTSVAVSVYTSDNATWKLYSNYNCTNEISNKQMSLNVGANTAYIKVTAQDNITTRTYTITITRAASSACDITAVTAPSGAIFGVKVKTREKMIIANVPNATSSVIVDVTTSANASWKLYGDVNCTNEISNKQMNLNVGINTAYIKVTAQDNTTTKIYPVIIVRAASNGL